MLLVLAWCSAVVGKPVQVGVIHLLRVPDVVVVAVRPPAWTSCHVAVDLDLSHRGTRVDLVHAGSFLAVCQQLCARCCRDAAFLGRQIFTLMVVVINCES